MTTPSVDLASFGLVAAPWITAGVLEQLASVDEQIRQEEAFDQAEMERLRGLETETQPDAPTEAASQQSATSLQGDTWKDTVNPIDQQGEASQSCAVSLSRGQTTTAATGLTDLSVELLTEIVSYFQSSSSDHDSQTCEMGEMGVIPLFSESDRQTVQSLRLVSRLFNSLASPLLLPIIELTVDTKSLDFAQCISSNPLVASGIRAIRVGLEHRPPVLARSFDRWREHRARVLDTRVLTSEIAHNGFRRRKYKKTGNKRRMEQCDKEHQNLRQALIRARLVGQVMRDWTNAEGAEQEQDELHKAEVNKCREFVRESHNEYVRIYEEQAQLVRERSFTGAVARLAAQARRPVALELFDSKMRLPDRVPNESRTIFRSEAVLSSHLSSALKGPRETLRESQAQHIPASLVSDLPVAIQQAGGTLNAFQLSCVGMIHHPNSTTCTLANSREGVHAGYQHLKVLHMSKIPITADNPPTFVSPMHRRRLEEYFAALLSSQRLEEVIIDGTTNLGPTRLGLSRPLWVSLGAKLGEISWPQVRKVRISLMTMTQMQVEGLLLGLGNRVEEITLAKIHLISGSWTGALDILREKHKHSRGSMEGPCPIKLMSLTGGGLSVIRILPELNSLEDYVNNRGAAKNPLSSPFIN